jgi:hypothetical protein
MPAITIAYRAIRAESRKCRFTKTNIFVLNDNQGQQTAADIQKPDASDTCKRYLCFGDSDVDAGTEPSGELVSHA